MRLICSIFWREYKTYFISPVAYIYMIAFVSLISWLFFRAFFLVGQADMRAFFELAPWILLFFVPAVSMSKWSEEKKNGTIELLLTLPIKYEYIVLGKFFAGMGLIITTFFFTLTIPLTIMLIGVVDYGPIVGGYIGLMLLSAAYLSVGLFVSSLTENQIIAFIVSIFMCFIFYVLGTPIIGGISPGLLTSFFQYLGLAYHYESISRGVIDSGDVIYYLSFIVTFLYFNWLAIRIRR